METFDLFKDWTPEMIESLKPSVSKHSNRGRTGMPHTEETRRRISEWNRNKTLSEEHKRKISRTKVGVPHGESHKRRISESLMGHPVSEETRRKISEAKIGRPLGPCSEERRGKISRAMMGNTSMRIYLAKLNPEEKEAWLRNSIRSDEAIKRCMEASHKRPTMPEMLVDGYLKENFPGEYGYNGDYSLGIRIGGRIPDFPSITGKKEVISVMGGIGRYHFLEDEKDEIAHYAKYGHKCTVVWEWDCWIPGELDRIFRGGTDGLG